MSSSGGNGEMFDMGLGYVMVFIFNLTGASMVRVMPISHIRSDCGQELMIGSLDVRMLELGN